MVSEHLIFRHRPPASIELDEAACQARSGYNMDGVCHLGERWEADLTYVFENVGDARTLQIGLPFRLPPDDSEHAGPGAGAPIGELRTQIDNTDAPVTILDEVLSGDGWMAERTYLVEVPFEAGQTRTLRHHFEAWAGGNASGGSSFTYLLETGRGWAGPIGHVTIEFDLGTHVPCLAVSLPHEHRGNLVHIELRDWEPDTNVEIHWLRASATLGALGLYDETPGAAAAVCSAHAGEDALRVRRTIERVFGAPAQEGDDELLGQPPQACLWNDVFAGTMYADDTSDVPRWQREAVSAMSLPTRDAWETLLPTHARECLDALPAASPASDDAGAPASDVD